MHKIFGAFAQTMVIVVALSAKSVLAEGNVQVNGGYRHDSNVFRQSQDFPDQSGAARADDIYSTGIAGTAEVNPGSFNVVADVDAGYEWYQRNSQLDNFNYSASAAVKREEGGVVGLRLDATSRRSLSSYADVSARVRNIQDLQRMVGEFTLPITPEFRLVANPDYTQSRNSADFVKVNDFRQYGLGVGVGWFSPIGNSIAFTVSRRQTDGLEDRLVPVSGTAGVVSRIDLRDTAASIRLRYAFSVLTSIEANVSLVHRNDKSILNNDYTGPSGEVVLRYEPRQTLKFALTAGRRLEAQSYLYVDSVRSDYVSGEVASQILDRLELKGSAAFGRRRFRYDPLALIASSDDRRERTIRLNGSARYRIFDRILLGGFTSYERRRSNVLYGDYSAFSAGATISAAFGNRKSTVF